MTMSLNHPRRNPVRSDDDDCSFIFNYFFFFRKEKKKKNIIKFALRADEVTGEATRSVD
jgi:hypothetical protein